MQDMPQPSTSNHQPSALLRCLSQLNADTWAQVLLPKLVEQGSAADVTLSCSQLRDLCYISRQSLKLGAMLDSSDPWSLRSQVQNLPMHFPHCSTVLLELKSDNCYNSMPCVLPALARLPHLHGLSMQVVQNMQPLLACTMLDSLSVQLPALRGLTLSVQDPGDWLGAEAVHRQLGGMTQLTQLRINLTNTQDDTPLPYPAGHHLSGLQQLQHLAIWADYRERYLRYYEPREQTTPPPQIMSALTSLTRLDCNVFDMESFDVLACCANLQHVAVCLAWPALNEPSPADWAGLATLTRLTELRMLNLNLSKASPEAWEALSKLSRLQVVAAADWEPDFLPALAACTQLTEICGRWEWRSSSVAPHIFPHVLTLTSARHMCDRSPARFPNLRHFRDDVLMDGLPYIEYNILTPADLCSLSQHCTGLRELVLTAKWDSFEEGYEESDYIAALQSLTSLQHLTCLKFTPSDDFMFLALVQASRVLESHSLQELHLVGCLRNLSAAAWAQLAQLQRLRKLLVQSDMKEVYNCLSKDARVVLWAFSGCGSVLLCLPGSSQPFDDALVALREAGLPTPQLEFVKYT